MRPRTWWLLGALTVLTVASIAVYATTDRQAEIAAKGQQVMPFDLDRTTHRFAKSPTGGTQTVVSDDTDDTQQIRLIRDHLTEEATRFEAGDYGDPASIHGREMPGLRQLEQGHQAVDVHYAETPTGAQITYTTTDASMVTALHAWFDAQISDHGDHAS
ncbi:hypothetical protein [Herbidospora daliensis]|uniref:hypothetical protein n=1 Tax=Herbidospora daliensis TaxID=295585 RepID=UPI0007C658A6|nr:hypothetical protein [Herbidospora daliensis]